MGIWGIYRESRLNSLIQRFLSSELTVGITLSIIVGVVAGLGAVAFRWLIRGFQWLFFNQGARMSSFLGDYYVIILPAIGGLIVGVIIYYLAREAKGEGPPEIMEAFSARGGWVRKRVAAVKMLVSSICIGSGGSVGREGPIVQIGASFGSAIGQWFKLPNEWMKTLLLCGAAGGISATFNAPIAGVFFAHEVIARKFVTPSLILVVISSVAADFIAHAFLGSSPSFLIPAYEMASNWEMLPYILLGVVVAFAALGFIRFFYKCEDIFVALKFPMYLKPALGGILIGLIGWYNFDLLGMGYGGFYGLGGIWVEQGGLDLALAGQIGLGMLLIMLILKMVATSVTLGSGGSGGIFAPSLFMGALLGGAFGIGVHTLFPSITSASTAEAAGAYALVGMGAFFAAVVRGPFTAIIILFEMTRNYELILPLMAAVVISTVVARQFNRESIYSLRLLRKGVILHPMEEADVLTGVTVGEVMTTDFPTVPTSMSVKEVMALLDQSHHHGFPVIDDQGRLYGCVTLADVENAVKRGQDDLKVKDIAITSMLVAYTDQSLRDILKKLGDQEMGRIPVVDRKDRTRLVGVLRRHDIIKAYNIAAKRGALGG